MIRRTPRGPKPADSQPKAAPSGAALSPAPPRAVWSKLPEPDRAGGPPPDPAQLLRRATLLGHRAAPVVGRLASQDAGSPPDLSRSSSKKGRTKRKLTGDEDEGIFGDSSSSSSSAAGGAATRAKKDDGGPTTALAAALLANVQADQQAKAQADQQAKAQAEAQARAQADAIATARAAANKAAAGGAGSGAAAGQAAAPQKSAAALALEAAAAAAAAAALQSLPAAASPVVGGLAPMPLSAPAPPQLPARAGSLGAPLSVLLLDAAQKSGGAAKDQKGHAGGSLDPAAAAPAAAAAALQVMQASAQAAAGRPAPIPPAPAGTLKSLSGSGPPALAALLLAAQQGSGGAAKDQKGAAGPLDPTAAALRPPPGAAGAFAGGLAPLPTPAPAGTQPPPGGLGQIVLDPAAAARAAAAAAAAALALQAPPLAAGGKGDKTEAKEQGPVPSKTLEQLNLAKERLASFKDYLAHLPAGLFSDTASVDDKHAQKLRDTKAKAEQVVVGATDAYRSLAVAIAAATPPPPAGDSRGAAARARQANKEIDVGLMGQAREAIVFFETQMQQVQDVFGGSLPTKKFPGFRGVSTLPGLYHTGDPGDPIPFIWYKSADSYKSFATKAKTFQFPKGPYLPGKVKGTLTATAVKEGDVLTNVGSAHPDRGPTVPDVRLALSDMDVDLKGLDIDHVKDLGFGGADEVSNMWPLAEDVNRRPVKGWRTSYGLNYKLSTGALETKAINDLMGKRFVVKGFMDDGDGPVPAEGKDPAPESGVEKKHEDQVQKAAAAAKVAAAARPPGAT